MACCLCAQGGDLTLAYKATEALEIELAQLAKWMLSTKARATTMMVNQHQSHHFTTSFLLDVAHCFKNRVLQCWGASGAGANVHDGAVAETMPVPVVAGGSENLPSHSLILTEDESDGLAGPTLAANEKTNALEGIGRSSRDSRIPFPRSSGGLLTAHVNVNVVSQLDVFCIVLLVF